MLLTTLGGLALFLLGIHRIADSLQQVAGPVARRWMAAATRSPFLALATGTGVAAATQSGTATAVTTLGLVGGGLVAIPEGIALLLGAKLGATLAIQLAAFHLGDYALAMIGVGYLGTLWQRSRPLGALLLGAGLLFLGLDLTVSSMTGLADSEIFNLIMATAGNQPLAVAALGAVLGGLLSSSNGAAAVALGLYLSGAIELPSAIALTAGGNAGSALMPLLVSRSFDTNAQRVALMQMLFTALGAVLTVVALGPFAQLVSAIGGGPAREVANAHTAFNLAVALVGTALAPLLARLSGRLVPTGEDDAAPKYLRVEAIEDAPLGLALALRETVRISDQVAVMTELAMGNLASGRWDPEPIRARETKVDRLTQHVIDYLARMRRTHGEDPNTERLLLAASELEHVGDQIRRLGRREDKLRAEGIEFSREGRAQLTETGNVVLARMRTAFTALATGDGAMARQVIAGRPAFEELVARMRVAHMARLEARLPESRASSSHHLEVLTLLRDVDASVTRVAGWTREMHAQDGQPV